MSLLATSGVLGWVEGIGTLLIVGAALVWYYRRKICSHCGFVGPIGFAVCQKCGRPRRP